ncbi:MAG: flagellar basal body P-ring formation protein FlgA [Planctomycetes bacterium]|nr:flagellar basal body P-ring formation protein FlgA [Planctomycetota bacterium]
MIALLLSTLLLSTPAAAPETVVTVTLPLEATVDGSEFTLGDVATVDGADTAEVKRVRELELGYAPAPGYSRVIQRWRVEQQLQREFTGLTVVFEGSSACRVWPRVAEISPAELEAAAREMLAGELAGEDVELKLHRELSEEQVPAGRSTRRLEADPSGAEVRTGLVNVPVKILIDGAVYRTVWVGFDVTLFRELPVLKRDVPLGGRIAEGDLVLQRTAIEAAFTGEALSPSKLVGATAKRPLHLGMPVLAHDVKREPAVKRGETVTLEVINGQVLVGTKVVSLMDGYLGDVVAVRTVDTGKELTAVVSQKGRVELRLGVEQQN